MEQGSAFEQLVPLLFADILINISKFFEMIRVAQGNKIIANICSYILDFVDNNTQSNVDNFK